MIFSHFARPHADTHAKWELPNAQAKCDLLQPVLLSRFQMNNPTYDQIGHSYGQGRRPDPRIARVIRDAIGDATSVLNVGAGTGNYEPTDLQVTAVEPSATMIDQRPPNAAPVIQAPAEELPFQDGEFDVSLALLTVHHWSDWAKGLQEMRRVARRQVIVLCQPDASSVFWLADYFPEMLQLPSITESPGVTDIRAHLDVVSAVPLLIPHDCVDGFLGSYWRRPHAYLNPQVRASTSPLAQLDADVVSRGVSKLSDDLETRSWDVRYANLLELTEFDAGYRLVTAKNR